MNYQLHYTRLIDRAKDRVVTGYVERHHVIPKCLGGLDNSSNIVRLTPEEHYLAHQLLVKINPGNSSLIFAVKMMTVSGNYIIRNNKMFGWIRKLYAEALSNRVVSTETRKKMSENAKNRIFSDITRKKMSISSTGNSHAAGSKHSLETKEKIAAAGKRPCSEETRIKIGIANAGRKLPPISDETRKKLSESATGRVYKLATCTYCNKEGGITGMKRWHFENCKAKYDRS